MTPRSKKLLALVTYGISLYARATCESRAGAPHKCEKYGPLFSPLLAGFPEGLIDPAFTPGCAPLWFRSPFQRASRGRALASAPQNG
jgi:hypothetical protein